jgi:hypothetical protein
MKPTAKLRFVQRQVEIDGDHKLGFILQQWWEEDAGWSLVTNLYNKERQLQGEWRDVPMEAE